MMQVPNLPGFRSNKPRTTMRPQNFVVTKDHIPVENHPPKVQAPAVDETERFSRSQAFAQSTKRVGGAGANAGAAAETTQPAFVALDRQVLRFFAYFKEAVVESPTEAQRIRKVTIQFFLVDGTIMVVEHREENSGIPQGTFVKRHRIPGGSGADGAYDFHDLGIGAEVTFYGRTMRIVDVDGFTREFYAAQGLDLGPSEEFPSDDYSTTVAAMKINPDGYYGKQNNPLKKFMEASLGRVANGRGETKNLQQFLKNDTHVLRFFCVWDDTKSAYGDKNAFTLHYFLADDTVEVREVPVHNSGRDNFPMLLSRQKLPKNWRVDFGNDAARGVEDDPAPDKFVRPQDLFIGHDVDVFGRNLHIVACDAFTRKWYAGHGAAQPSNEVLEEKKVEAAPLPTPPHTGFGDDEDSMASCVALVPKPPKKDFNKFMKNEGRVLRFSARLARACPEDRHRSFIIQLYLSDDTLMIYESGIRNSGIVGGKFLNRAKYKKDDGTVYAPTDFVPGTEVAIYKRKFFIVDADDYTKADMPSLIPAGFLPSPALSDSACAAAMAKVRDASRAQGKHGVHALKLALRAGAAAAGGAVDRAALGAVLGPCGLSDAELDNVYLALDGGSGAVPVEDVVAALQGQMSHRRLALCHAAFDVLDKACTDSVKIDTMVDMCDFSQDERVLSGEQTIMMAAEEFVNQWTGTAVDGAASRDEFLDYNKSISSTIDSDDYFQLMMKRAWKI